MENKTYVCRKLYLYNFLVEQGFKPYKVAPDKYDPDKLIWLFEDSIDLRDYVEIYYSRKPKNM